MTESMRTTPSTLTPLASLRAVTVTVEPSVCVVAFADIDPTVATAGASSAGIVACALDRSVGRCDTCVQARAGVGLGGGRPLPEAAVTRNGYGGTVPAG